MDDCVSLRIEIEQSFVLTAFRATSQDTEEKERMQSPCLCVR